MKDLVETAIGGDRQALARLLSHAERGGEASLEIESLIAPRIGGAFVLGITGPPGAGKSTLINALLPIAREAMGAVAVLAVDPTSPFSQGAILGDRVRMQVSPGDTSTFIRSMASRGELGGLARAASTAVRIFDACGWPLVIVETLGVGQVELEIMGLADSVLVVLNPGWGDSIQANKAGITEAGNLFAVNKADKPGAAQTRKDLLESLALLRTEHKPEVLETIASEAQGITELWDAISAERERLASIDTQEHLQSQRRNRFVAEAASRQLRQYCDSALTTPDAIDLIAGVAQGETDMSTLIKALLQQLSTQD